MSMDDFKTRLSAASELCDKVGDVVSDFVAANPGGHDGLTLLMGLAASMMTTALTVQDSVVGQIDLPAAVTKCREVLDAMGAFSLKGHAKIVDRIAKGGN